MLLNLCFSIDSSHLKLKMDLLSKDVTGFLKGNCHRWRYKKKKKIPFSLLFQFFCIFTKHLESEIMSDTSVFGVFRYVSPWNLSAQAICDSILKYFHLLKLLSHFSFI